MTKQFACASVFFLAEAGKLSMADKVASTSRPDQGDRHLAPPAGRHGLRLPDYYPLDFVDTGCKADAPRRLIAEYAGGPLDFEPDSRWSYSNTGYMILGQVVEKATGEALGSSSTAASSTCRDADPASSRARAGHKPGVAGLHRPSA